jgi:hypothetical protein
VKIDCDRSLYEILEATDPANAENAEKRDFLQVEKDAWNGRKRIGDIPG